MKLGEAIPKYQAYRNQLHDNQNQIYKKLKEAKEKIRSGAESVH